VDEHKFTDGQARYERVSNHHHDHMICVTCGKIVEFEDEIIECRQEFLAEQMGFEVVDHWYEVYVRCKIFFCMKF
jgi:Fur family ferric uptake transcriptional regulator